MIAWMRQKEQNGGEFNNLPSCSTVECPCQTFLVLLLIGSEDLCTHRIGDKLLNLVDRNVRGVLLSLSSGRHSLLASNVTKCCGKLRQACRWWAFRSITIISSRFDGNDFLSAIPVTCRIFEALLIRAHALVVRQLYSSPEQLECCNVPTT